MPGQRGWEAAGRGLCRPVMPRRCQLAQGRQRCQAAGQRPGTFLGDCMWSWVSSRSPAICIPCPTPVPAQRVQLRHTSTINTHRGTWGLRLPWGPAWFGLTREHRTSCIASSTLHGGTGRAHSPSLPGHPALPWWERSGSPLPPQQPGGTPLHTGEQFGLIRPQSRGPGEVLGKAFSPAVPAFLVPSTGG